MMILYANTIHSCRVKAKPLILSIVTVLYTQYELSRLKSDNTSYRALRSV